MDQAVVIKIIEVAAFLFLAIPISERIFVKSLLHSSKTGIVTRFNNSIKFIFFLLLFPLGLLVLIFKSKMFDKNQFVKKLLLIIFSLIVLLPLWIFAYYQTYQTTRQVTNHYLGYYEDSIPLAGTGSMYPTFPKGNAKTPEDRSKEVVGDANMTPYPNGLVFLGKRYFGYEIKRGDIVNFSNSKTFEITKRDIGEETGFIKRVIGLPGDTLETRDGLVYINNEAQKEEYIARARSTFGGEFLPDCQKVTVPAGKLFVMGDNRKGSLDSRSELEFISYDDISHVIPWEKQIGTLDSHFRDVSHDLESTSKITLDKNAYLRLLNEKRAEDKLPALKYQPKLESSAERRARAILKYNDFSFDGKVSGLSMDKAQIEAGYANFARGEIPIQGYYEAQELFDNQFAFPDKTGILLKKEYQEIGIAEIAGEVNGCPTQVIVQHVAGYVPPNYKREDIESWQKALSNLKEVQPGWEKLKTFEEFYTQHKADVDRINEIIAIRIAHTQSIVTRMQNNQWLTNEEQRYVDEDVKLGEEQASLANKLNGE